MQFNGEDIRQALVRVKDQLYYAAPGTALAYAERQMATIQLFIQLRDAQRQELPDSFHRRFSHEAASDYQRRHPVL